MNTIFNKIAGIIKKLFFGGEVSLHEWAETETRLSNYSNVSQERYLYQKYCAGRL